MELNSVEMKNMEAILEKYERIVMDCAVRQAREFSVPDLHSALCGMGETKLSKTDVQRLLNRLVKKRLLKKRYARIRYLKFEPLYCSRVTV